VPSLRRNIRRNLKELVAHYFKGTDGKPYRLIDYHIEILDAMFEGGNLVVNVPTDHMKSSLGCFLFPILSLMDNPNETHIICGANINDSRRRVQAIARELETNKELIRDFPWVARPSERQNRIWTATQINVVGRDVNKPNPSVLASAIGSNDLKGRRGKLIMDDVEGLDARTSPVKREQLYDWLKFEAWRCYEDQKESERPLLCLLGTPFDVDSIYFRMEQQGWKVIRYPVYTRDEYDVKVERHRKQDLGWTRPADVGHTLQHQVEYLWPEKAAKVERARKTLRELEFAVSYLMDPTGGDPSRMSSAIIQQRMSEAKQGEGESSTFITLDPATGSTGRRLDYAGIAVVKIFWPQGEELPAVEVLEAYAFTRGIIEQVHLCARLSEIYGERDKDKWVDKQLAGGPKKTTNIIRKEIEGKERFFYPILYEVDGQQGGTYQNNFMHLHPEVPLQRHYTGRSNKFDTSMGLTIVKRLVEVRKLFVLPDQIESEGIQAFIEEVRDLQPPFKVHDHISAAIWFAVRYVYEHVRHYRGPSVGIAYKPLIAMWPTRRYEDDPSLSPVQRAEQAMAYDRVARSGVKPVIGYRTWGRRQVMPWERDKLNEQRLFQEALTKRRGT